MYWNSVLKKKTTRKSILFQTGFFVVVVQNKITFVNIIKNMLLSSLFVSSFSLSYSLSPLLSLSVFWRIKDCFCIVFRFSISFHHYYIGRRVILVVPCVHNHFSSCSMQWFLNPYEQCDFSSKQTTAGWWHCSSCSSTSNNLFRKRVHTHTLKLSSCFWGNLNVNLLAVCVPAI